MEEDKAHGVRVTGSPHTWFYDEYDDYGYYGDDDDYDYGDDEDYDYGDDEDDEEDADVWTIDYREYDFEEADFWFPVEVDSLSLPKISVRGLPAGVAYDADYNEFWIKDAGKLKSGVYLVTITAQNQSGVKAEKVLKVVVRLPNEPDEIGSALGVDFSRFDDFTLGDDVDYFYWDGDQDTEWVEEGEWHVPSAWGLVISGLPAGLTLVKRETIYDGEDLDLKVYPNAPWYVDDGNLAVRGFYCGRYLDCSVQGDRVSWLTEDPSAKTPGSYVNVGGREFSVTVDLGSGGWAYAEVEALHCHYCAVDDDYYDDEW